ncbi:hypothetical protein [Leuconostoc sp.]|uniref:hypothetical protein n=1 Tax=Leuconostoc sp. TaxID=1930076 RepID=UPI00257E2BDB|nr:hypothetical protein [Leuconostoc sp.]NLT85664.1 hypothetical protein [Leuconostoc sp.]
MTFDESIAKVGTYLKNNDLSNSDNNDRFFYNILNDLRQEYAPTVEMTEDEKNVLVEFKKNWTFTQFVSAIEGNYENNMYFEKVEKTFRKMRIANGYMIDEEKMMLAWLHPKTIEIVDE